ncbi:MAG TPA: DUF1707 domain-containing protein [Micromonosporaceae bacterium]|jgi:hypothetical protein|nr:DUF1707 domain-containing protein [Micromonosporaceae bacterium]
MTAETSGTPANLPQVRVSDAERETIVRRLNDATSEGRLTLEEFSERVSAALAARTQGDLDILMTDLPAHPSAPLSRTANVPVPSSGPRISQITPIGSVKRGGHWRLDRDMEIGTVVGSVKLDLRHAEIAAAVVDLHVRATLGSVKVWIPSGIAVDVDGATVLGSRTVADSAAVPGAPLLRLHVDTVVGSVKVYRR